MRIVNSVLGDARGGRWQVVCDYTRLLAERGHQVMLLLDRRQRADPGAVPAGVQVKTVRNHGHYDYPAAWRLRPSLKHFGPDLAIAHCSRSVALLKHALPRYGPPVIAVSHSNKVRRLLIADAYVALSAHIETQILKAGTSRPCYRLPNMVRIGPGQPGSLPPPRHQPIRIGALGRFDPVKGLDVFVDALGLLHKQGHEFEAVIGGEGEQYAALSAAVAAAGLSDRVTFPGWIADVPAFLGDIDILCVPARSDAFGLTPLEAARARVPLVLSRATGHIDMFAVDREALFAAVGDPHETADCIERLMRDEGLSESLVRAARARVEAEYSEAAVAKRLFQIIELIDK